MPKLSSLLKPSSKKLPKEGADTSSQMDDFDPYSETQTQSLSLSQSKSKTESQSQFQSQPSVPLQENPLLQDNEEFRTIQRQLQPNLRESERDRDNDDVEYKYNQEEDVVSSTDNPSRLARLATTAASNNDSVGIGIGANTSNVLTNRAKTVNENNNNTNNNNSGNSSKERNLAGFPAVVVIPPAPKRIKTTSVRDRKRIGKHLTFRERPDFLKSRYFIFTFPYGVFYLVGAVLGYSRKRNLFCLIISGFLGLLFILFSVLHALDYYSGAPLESVYVSLPFIISLFFCVLMACFYAIGSVFKTALLISIVCGIATVFYGYALVKDYSDGSYYKDNTYVKSKDSDDTRSLLSDFDNTKEFSSQSDTTFNPDEVQAIDYQRPTKMPTNPAASSANNDDEEPTTTNTKFFAATNRNTMADRNHTHSSRYNALLRKGIKIKDSE